MGIKGSSLSWHCRDGLWGAISCFSEVESHIIIIIIISMFPYYLAGCELCFLSRKQPRKLFSCCLKGVWSLRRNCLFSLRGHLFMVMLLRRIEQLLLLVLSRVTGSISSTSAPCFWNILDVLKNYLKS